MNLLEKEFIENIHQRLTAMQVYLRDYPQEDLYLEGHVAAALKTLNNILRIGSN